MARFVVGFTNACLQRHLPIRVRFDIYGSIVVGLRLSVVLGLAKHEIWGIIGSITPRIVCRQTKRKEGKENVSIRSEVRKAMDQLGSKAATPAGE
jgi:hypothetical protein